MTYAKFQADCAPPALQHPRWRQLIETWARSKDAVSDAVKDAMRCMLVGECPEDALSLHAAERRLERFPNETAAQHRQRMLDVWKSFQYLGTTKGLEAALSQLNFGAARIHPAAGPAPSWWVGEWPPPSEGAKPPQWPGAWPVAAGAVGALSWSTRFWIDLSETAWGFHHWGEPFRWRHSHISWGSSAPQADIALFRRVVHRWRPAHVVCIGAFVRRSDGSRLFWPLWPHKE
ncbi:MAG: phage tail protein [Polyangiales bacterium]